MSFAIINVVAFNNERLKLTFDLTQWAALYPEMGAASFWGEVRASGKSVAVDMSFGAPPNTMAYDTETKILIIRSPASKMSRLLGAYQWDFGFTPVDLDPIRIGGGTFDVKSGVTRHAKVV